MQAIAVRPGEPWSVHRTEVDLPPLESIPNGRGVQVRVLQVGLCGTDAEIAEGHFGYPPPGEPSLVLGHEHLGQVAAVGLAVTEPGLQPGRLVVASNRRPGDSPWDAIGLQDFTADLDIRECGIRGVRGYLVERYVEDARYLTPVPDALLEVGVLTEPMSVVEKGMQQAWAVQRRLHLWEPQRALVVGSGTIGLLAVLALRLRGIETCCIARRRPPTRNADLVADAGARYLSLQDGSLEDASLAHGPFDLVVEASGAAEHLPAAAATLAPNGVLVLASVTSASKVVPVDLAAWNQSFVLWNKAMVGTVNSAPVDWSAAVGTLAQAATVLPGWTGRLLTTRIDGLDADAILAHLQGGGDAIKTVVHLAEPVQPR